MKGFLRDDRGSGIVTVMVAMLMLVALGSALLFASYTGFRLKTAERRGGEAFYDAETAMNEVRAGVQQAVTESIASAYEQVLVEYNTSKDTEGDFRRRFEAALFSWTNSSGGRLLNRYNDLMSYEPSTLEGFISEREDGSAVLSCPSPLVTVISETVRDADGKELLDEFGIPLTRNTSVTLQGVSIKYTDAEGYESNVTTDITVTLPDFDYSLTEYSLTGVPEFAMVARESLTQTANNVVLELSGNAYAGRIDLSQSGTTLTVRGGTLICGGDVTVSGLGFGARPHLVVEPSASLWANRITVGRGTAVALGGEAYVADDLELAGDGASAALSGKYYGFGYLSDAELAGGARYYCTYCGQTSKAIFAACPSCGRAGGAAPCAESSSSIVINGRNTSLDLSGVTDLVLAGNSFVDTGTGGFSGSDVVMGQSVSVRSDQMAYLVPRECITLASGEALPSNPYTFTGAAPEWTVDESAVAEKGLSKYISAEGGEVRGVQAVFSNLASTGTHIVYFYMSFETRAAANQYFTDYFSAHSDSISSYLKLYSNTLSAARKSLTSGTAYDLDPAGKLTLLPSSGENSLSVSAAKYNERYQNMCVTLSSRPKSSTPTPKDKNGNILEKNPFDYVVNRLELPDVTTEFFDESGTLAGVIQIGDCSVSQFAEHDGLRVIIATGSVVVDEPFTGLIVSDKTVTMNSHMYSSPEQVTSALRAENAAGITLLHYLNVGDDEHEGGADLAGGATWDTYSLVSYSNWKKS